MPNRNALTREFVSGSFSGTPSSTLTRRIRSGCCARDASGHVAAASLAPPHCPSQASEAHRSGSNWEVGSGQTDARQYPLYPQKQTLIERVRMSALCQKQTLELSRRMSRLARASGITQQKELFGSVLGEDALQCAPMHFEAAGGFRNVAVA